METFDYDAFRLKFPEFDCNTDEEIQAALDVVCALYGNFCFVENEKTKAMLACLAVAHHLKMSDPIMGGGTVKRIKNQQDEIEYANNSSITDPFGLSATYYGSQLERLLDVLCVSAGLNSFGGASMYTTDIGYRDNCCCD